MISEEQHLRILVTGAGGFVGPHLLAELINAGHEPVALDRNAGGSEAPCHFVAADLGDSPQVEKVLRDVRPDAIIHLAAWSHVGHSWKAPAEVYRANTVNTISLYDCASRLLGPDARFLHVSSADVYAPAGPEELPLTEKSPARATSPYSASKLAAEEALRLLRVNGGARLAVVRAFNHIGPGQAPTFVCPVFARQVAEIEAGVRKKMTHGNLGARRDFTDVRDMVRAYRHVIEASSPAPLYVASSGRAVAIGQIAETLFRLAGIEPRMEKDPALFRPVDTMELRGDSSLLHRDFGWQAEISLETTLADILEEARRSIRR